MSDLRKFEGPVWRVFGVIAVFTLFVNVLVLASPLYMLQIYDRVLVSRSADTLIMISIAAVLAIGVFGLLEGVRGIMASRAAARFDLAVSEPALQRILRSGRAEQLGSEPLRDIAQIRGFIGNRVALGLLDLPFAPFFIVLIFLIHPMLGYLTVGGAAVLMLLAWLNDRATTAAQKHAGEQAQAAMGSVNALIRNSETLRAMGMINPGLAKWSTSQTESMVANDQVGVRNSSFFGVTRFVRMMLQIAILGLGAYYVLMEEMTAGMIFASSLISGRALGPIEQAIGAWRSFTQARLAHQRLASLFAETRDEADHIALPVPEGRIRVEGLIYAAAGNSVSLTPQDPILKGLNFSLDPADVLVVLGASGAGKSTLARLLAGAANPDRGVVRLDGADITVWPDTARFAHVGYLPQQLELMPGTIAENIARFDQVPNDEAIVDAARRAHVHELITQFPDAYQTRVGPGGRPLSGGQTQRIALARAFYGSPAFLVLDEPNAHLDSDGEARLSESILEAKKRGTTVVIITQRTSVLQVADKVLVLNAGSIETFGPRDEVLPRMVKPVKGNMQAPRQQAPVQSPAPSPVPPAEMPPQTLRAAAAKFARKQGEQTGTPVSARFVPMSRTKNES